MRTTIWTLVLSVALVSAAEAATAEQKCQAAKLNALRSRSFCIEGERRKEVLGKTPATAKCAEKLAKAIGKADEAAAKKGAACRWLDNADGTATDLNSGLQWELKTNDGSVHDKDTGYDWSPNGPTPNGAAFTSFLGTLNGGVSADGSTTTGCFAGKCDWRMPTIGELRGILDAQFPSCTINPCTTIPGFTTQSIYWPLSTSALDPFEAWSVSFFNGHVTPAAKTFLLFVRAVRGGS